MDDEITIVLVEDDPGHALLTERHLRRASIRNELVHLADGRAALDWFFADGAPHLESEGPPLLVLLDLNLPAVDGLGVLEQLKADPRTAGHPVIILTTSENPREIDRCRELGTGVYLTKPIDATRFSKALGEVGVHLVLRRDPPDA